MPQIRRKARSRRDSWGREHLDQLKWGWDFFHDAWGDPAQLPMGQRDGWPDAETLDDMQACWDRHREEILAMPKPDDKPLWGSLVFDEGVDPTEAIDILSDWRAEQRRQRGAEDATA